MLDSHGLARLAVGRLSSTALRLLEQLAELLPAETGSGAVERVGAVLLPAVVV